MNTAARMEQTSRPGCIQLTVQTRELLPPQLDLTATDGVEIKVGRGSLYRAAIHAMRPCAENTF